MFIERTRLAPNAVGWLPAVYLGAYPSVSAVTFPSLSHTFVCNKARKLIQLPSRSHADSGSEYEHGFRSTH